MRRVACKKAFTSLTTVVLSKSSIGPFSVRLFADANQDLDGKVGFKRKELLEQQDKLAGSVEAHDKHLLVFVETTPFSLWPSKIEEIGEGKAADSQEALVGKLHHLLSKTETVGRGRTKKIKLTAIQTPFGISQTTNMTT